MAVASAAAAKERTAAALQQIHRIMYGEQRDSHGANLGGAAALPSHAYAGGVRASSSVQIKPDFANAYYFRAKANDKLLQTKKAIDDLTQAIKIKSDFGEAYFHRGNLYEKINKKELACQDWGQASANGYYEANYVIKQKCGVKKKTNDDDY
jgi:tetratricopeptide (TPR) repeat protein